jgi:hypothetical protein
LGRTRTKVFENERRAAGAGSTKRRVQVEAFAARRPLTEVAASGKPVAASGQVCMATNTVLRIDASDISFGYARATDVPVRWNGAVVSTRAGRWEKQASGCRAFVPKPLPPEPPLRWDADLLRALSEADLALGRLDGLARSLPNPDLFVAMYVRREAVLSSQIEGTPSSLDDVLTFEVAAPGASQPADITETVNYVRAMNAGLGLLGSLPLSGRLIRKALKELARLGRTLKKRLHVPRATALARTPRLTERLDPRHEVFVPRVTDLPPIAGRRSVQSRRSPTCFAIACGTACLRSWRGEALRHTTAVRCSN